MIRSVLFIWFGVMATSSLAEDTTDRLPEPDYSRRSSDPAWLARVVQFHGHLGPSVVAGARIGMAGLRAVEAKGYFDVAVTCEGPLANPPQSCFLDGLQVATGATLGKRTLQWVQAERIVVRVRNTRTGKTAELRPTPALVDLLASVGTPSKAAGQRGPDQEPAGADQKVAEERLEAAARRLASMPEKEIVAVTRGGAAAAK
jgi:formylmethanofuran dehydrogenase subunit E